MALPQDVPRYFKGSVMTVWVVVKGAHLMMPPGESFISWDLPVEILVVVA